LDGSVPVPVPSPNATASTQGHRILLIEDNLDAADTLQELLELEGHTVSVAYDGREGVEKAQRELPTVVLCDLGLPGLTGFEVAAALRATPSLRDVFLVALTGYTQPDDIRKVRAAGFDAHVAKPARLETLVALLNRQPARP
jgi:CheY-like chemotaxis protein